MEPVKKIPVQDWMMAPETVAVFDALQDANAPPQVLFVGGCVRNALLGAGATDQDIATIHTPEDTTRRLQQAGIKVVPTGIEHGTVTAVIDGKGFEITTLRRDVETDGRRAVVAFTRDWAEDATRRDFTINTLLADLQGNIYDPIRSGISDLGAKRVVFVGDPATRIAEDGLRILRFFRFHALYGAGVPDAAGLAACRAAAGQIRTLSRERITQEFLKIIGAENASETYRIMFDHGIMTDLAAPEFDETALTLLIDLQNRSGTRSLAARLYCLCGGRDENRAAITDEYLLLSKMLRRSFESFFHLVPMDMPLAERLYRHGRDVGGQAALLRAVMNGRKAGGVMDDRDLALIRTWEPPVFPLTGGDLQDLGLEPGPRIGEVMRTVEDWWIAQGFRPDRQSCILSAKENI